jgi:uncharacterized repeat protein (TIGR03803 family)
MSKLIALAAGALFAGSVTAAIPAHASEYSVVYSFQGKPDGAYPFSGLVNVGGTLYGTTYEGGATNSGTAFGVTPAGTETMLYSFQGGNDGLNPWGGLTKVDGTLYGTTYEGGLDNYGTVFEVTTAGVKTTLYSFAGLLDRSLPVGGLIKRGATLYGTTSTGGEGSSCGTPGCGTVFKMTLAGEENVVFRFGNYADDAISPLGTLDASNGELYGTSYNSNDINTPLGAVFETTKKGTESVLHLFTGSPDGADPVGGLIEVNGTFYGTTESGGANEFGTVFSITPAGVETVLYNFTAVGGDGGGPEAALTDVDGTIYGVTGTGYDKNGYFSSTLFSITPAGVLTTLHTFGTGQDGDGALGTLIHLGHTLYGTTAGGGTGGKGTVFKYKP